MVKKYVDSILTKQIYIIFVFTVKKNMIFKLNGTYWLSDNLIRLQSFSYPPRTFCIPVWIILPIGTSTSFEQRYCKACTTSWSFDWNNLTVVYSYILKYNIKVIISIFISNWIIIVCLTYYNLIYNSLNTS